MGKCVVPTQHQQRLIDRIAAILETEPLVEALWLSGSLGKNEGDAWSDVDTLVLAKDAGEASKVIAARLNEIATPVLVNVLFGGRVLNVVTEDWERFDIAILQGDEINRYD